MASPHAPALTARLALGIRVKRLADDKILQHAANRGRKRSRNDGKRNFIGRNRGHSGNPPSAPLTAGDACHGAFAATAHDEAAAEGAILAPEACPDHDVAWYILV